VVDAASGSTQGRLQTTTADAEDSGAAAGWEIANERRERSVTATQWGTGTDTDAVKIAIEGYAKTSPTTPAVLVGNSGKADAGTLQLNRDRAQAFRTGSNSEG